MRFVIAALALAGAILLGSAASAGSSEEVREVYGKFAAAQNARDLDAVKLLLLDSPQFLWVSDGKSIWGRDAVLKRMALFQEFEVWYVTPELSKSVVVTVGADTAFLHLPLELTIGSTAAAPDKLRFLVSVLCVKTSRGWRIAALFTTAENAKD
jgi:uncharacterized protein (TIGR02246 family)